jgi:argininosuccinate lyase
MKLWEGRMSGEIDERLNKLNASIGFDMRMYKQDITGSIAHARMLGAAGIIDEVESEKIVAGLEGILADLESGAIEIDMSAEDIHTFVEGELTSGNYDAVFSARFTEIGLAELRDAQARIAAEMANEGA